MTVYTAVFTARVHGAERTVYMAVYADVHGVYGPCTPACKGPLYTAVHGTRPMPRAVYMVRPRPYTGYTYTVVYPVHGRVHGPCTRPPTAVYTNRKHGRARATYMVRP